MSERQVRLLYKSTCFACDAPIPAGTATWWDDARRHATCTDCAERRESSSPTVAEETARAMRDRRTLRRLEILQSRGLGLASR